MIFPTLLTIAFLAVAVNSKTIEVTNSNELSSALNSVQPGDTINLHDGNYNGDFVLSQSGVSNAKITITGSKKAVLSSTSFGFHLNANYTILRGFTVQNALKGIVLEQATENLLDDLDVLNTDEEGIVLIKDSSHNNIQNCNIHDTGRKNPGFGAGISVGQSVNNWPNGKPDYAIQNNIYNNTIGPNVTSECVDLKEGSCCGKVSGNYFDSERAAETYSDSSVSVKGENYLVEDNTSDHSRLNGFDVTQIIAASSYSGCENTIRNNHCTNLPWNGECAVNQSPDCFNTFTNNE